MSLVAVPILNSSENKREPIVRACLQSLADTVKWHGSHHKLYLIDDASTCHKTPDLYMEARNWLPFTLIQNTSGLGTARSVNRAWVKRQDGQSAIKMDSDIIVNDAGWLDKLEDAIGRDEKLGILSLRRRDLMESPYRDDAWKSELIRLPGKPGQIVHTIERVGHCIGSCQMYSAKLLEKIGYLVQFDRYGFDDSAAAVRCAVAGFYSAFYCNIDIIHADHGGTPYQTYKEESAGKNSPKFSKLCQQYISGERSIHHGPNENLADDPCFKE